MAVFQTVIPMSGHEVRSLAMKGNPGAYVDQGGLTVTRLGKGFEFLVHGNPGGFDLQVRALRLYFWENSRTWRWSPERERIEEANLGKSGPGSLPLSHKTSRGVA